MSDLHDFDLEPSGSPIGSYVHTLANVILITVSALASFSFFAVYSPQLVSHILPPTLSSLAAGLVGGFLLEGMTIVWQWLHDHHSDTHTQLSISRVGYVYSLVASVSVTAVYFVLSSSLITPYLTETFDAVISLSALGIIVATVSIQFVLSRQYAASSSKANEQQHKASLTAMGNTAKFEIQRQTTRANLQHTLGSIMQELPEASERHGKQRAKQYIREIYADPKVMANGRKK